MRIWAPLLAVTTALAGCAAPVPDQASSQSRAASRSGAAGTSPAAGSANPTVTLTASVTPSATATTATTTSSVPTVERAAVGTVRRDIVYGADAEQRLDLHLPPGASVTARVPVVVFVHGGSWFMGDKAMIDGSDYLGSAPSTRDALLRQGFAIASVNYRLSTSAPFPAQLDDLRAAVVAVRRLPDVDPAGVTLLGESAGGHLVLLAGQQVPGIARVVAFYPVTDLPALTADRRAAGCAALPTIAETQLLGVDPSTSAGRAAGEHASPAFHVRAGQPPTLLVHGTQDCTVPPAQSRRMLAALRQAGVPASLVTLDAGHADRVFWSSPQVQARLLAFLG